MAIQPTNAGINYQQRVAAQFLSLMLTDSSLEPWLSGSEGILESIRFESSDEIDDLVLENDQGVDRVLGLLKGKVFNEYSYLKTFDYAFWANAKGQRVFGQLQAMGIRMGSILWNRDIHSILTGRFCMKANLEQGDYTYVTQRGYVVRGSQAHLKSQVKLHNKILEKTKHDPMGFASITHTFGNYSGLIDKLEVGEEFRRCISFECVPYTSTIHELFDIDVKEDYYCPLIYLTIDGEIFEVGGHIFMLTNPLDLQKYLDNWKEKLGFDIGSDYCVVTIKHDTEFDNFVQDALNDGFKIIVDPWFGNYSDLARGYSIKSYDLILF